MKVLLVDDNRDMESLFTTIARTSNFDAIFLDSPLKALEYMTDNPVDVAIIDLAMPYMDGLRLVKEVKKNRARSPFFVCYTAHDLTEDMRQMIYRAGYDKIYQKPHHLGDIISEVIH